MDKKLPLYIADIKEHEDRMCALSLTEKPATGLIGKVLSNDSKGTKIFFPILPANTPIYRNNEAYGEHYVMFLPDVISDIIADANKRNVPFDIEHQGTPIDGVEWLENFQIDYKQGKLFKGYQGLTDGTWCAILNLVNPMLRAKICPLNIFGISISGMFSYHRVTLSEAIEFYKKIKM